MERFYTIEGLTPENLAGCAKPVRLAVIGNPIAHSKSPQMQQAALDAAHIDASYIRIQCGLNEQDFDHLLARLQQLGFIGVNITVPFKKKAFAAAVQTDALSKLCGASNTLLRQPDGWHAFNTDGPGFERAIRELTGGKSLSELRIVILGACGGAGAALCCQCALSGCRNLTLVNRPRPELEQTRAQLQPHCCGTLRTAHFDSSELPGLLAAADLIVNATSLGLHEGDPLPISVEHLSPGQYVYDIVPHDTALRRAAAARGCHAATGADMLLWQGVYAFQHWFNTLPAVSPMRAALSEAV